MEKLITIIITTQQGEQFISSAKRVTIEMLEKVEIILEQVASGELKFFQITTTMGKKVYFSKEVLSTSIITLDIKDIEEK